jgi:hypothetical protein
MNESLDLVFISTFLHWVCVCVCVFCKACCRRGVVTPLECELTGEVHAEVVECSGKWAPESWSE